jgi:hypothetical protein
MIVNPKAFSNFAFECNNEWFTKEIHNNSDETARWEKFWKRISNRIEITHVWI